MTAPRRSSLARAGLLDGAVRAYMDLFVMMQVAAFSHWLMLELTFAQARALILISARRELTVGQLATMLAVGKSTASILAGQLVERGLVTRTVREGDRRIAVLRLSPQGEEIGAGRRRERETQWRRWMSQLADSELAALHRGLHALRKAADRETSQEREPGRAGPARPALRRPVPATVR